MAAKSKPFSLYLLKKGSKIDRSALKIPDKSFLKQLPGAVELQFPHSAWIIRNKKSTPSWAKHLTDYFDLGNLNNQSSSFVLLFEAADRVWALCYGGGHHLIGTDVTEPGFGLKVVANTIAVNKIRSADTRTNDGAGRATRAQLAAGGSTFELGLAFDEEHVRHLAGIVTPDDSGEQWVKNLAGADSLKINAEWNLTQLGNEAEKLLEKFESDDYKTTFPFIGKFEPLSGRNPIVNDLNGKLIERIERRESTKVSVAAPTIFDENDLDCFHIYLGKEDDKFDLSLNGLYEWIDQQDKSVDYLLENVYVAGVNGDGNILGKRGKLRRYITAEIEHNSSTYALIVGQWYQLDNGYVNQVNKEVAALATSSITALPAWNKDEDEGEYNERIGETKDWIKLDKQNIYHGGPSQRNEAADLVAVDGTAFVHVKKMVSSATLSHLWGQGAVSATLYSLDGKYRKKVQAKIAGLPDEMSQIKTVYAVANDRDGKIEDELFFFSKVNLLNHCKTLQLIGCKTELIKIKTV